MGEETSTRADWGARIAVVAAVVTGLALLLSLCIQTPGEALAARETPSIYPPRPALTPLPAAARPEAGAVIRLRLVFDEDWPWYDQPWYDLLTVVEWQDEAGVWHTIDGWQGTPDEIRGDHGMYTAYKSWWLPTSLFGRGPYRWVIYDPAQDAALVTSEPFSLPSSDGSILWVLVELEP